MNKYFVAPIRNCDESEALLIFPVNYFSLMAHVVFSFFLMGLWVKLEVPMQHAVRSNAPIFC